MPDPLADLLTAPPVPRLDDWLGVWSIEPGYAAALIEAVRGMDWPGHLARAEMAARSSPRPSAAFEVAEANGKRLAVVPVLGTMMKSASSMGGTSTVAVRRQVREAARDDSVSGILLRIDSPGGTVAGTDTLAREVAQARRAKPVVAQVEDVGTSAAYWVASQASRVYASTRTALLGSIGTLLVVRKGAAGEMAVFRSGPHKGAGIDGLTEEQAAHLQGLVNGWQEVFTGAVAAGRRLDPARAAEAASGAAWLAGTAQGMGLIDGVQPVEQTLDLLSAMR